MADLKSRFSRRHFLVQSGLTAAAVPFIDLLKGSIGQAATPVAPLRLITIWSPFQVPEQYYHPKNSSGVMSSPGPLSGMNLAFDVGGPLGSVASALSPLAPFQSNLILFRGLNYGQGPNSHSSGASCFTGSSAINLSPGATPQPKATTPSKGAVVSPASSIDQYLFSRMAPVGSLAPINCGLFAYQWSNHCYDNALSWNAGAAVPMVANPLNIFNSYFGNLNQSSGSSSAAAATARRKQALSVAQAGLQALLTLLPSNSPSVPKLQSHLKANAEILANLQSSSSTKSCSPPTQASISNDPLLDNGSLDWSKLAPDMTSFISLIVQAFACDITRFANLKMCSSNDGPFGGETSQMPGLSSTPFPAANGYFHGMVTHTCSDQNTATDQQMALYKTYWYQQVATLMTALQAIRDPLDATNTQSLFDNTVILIGSEGPIQGPNGDQHNNGTEDQPFIVAGGCGGLFKMGQLIDVRGQGEVTSGSGGQTTTAPGIAHNALLTNIINAFETNQLAYNPSYKPLILGQYGDYGFPVNPASWLS